MSTNNPARRIARIERLLKELGHEDVAEALRHAQEMKSALKILHTWSDVEGCLVPKHVRDLTAKALRYDK